MFKEKTKGFLYLALFFNKQKEKKTTKTNEK